MLICPTCAVEHAAAVDVCAICADERQWVQRRGSAGLHSTSWPGPATTPWCGSSSPTCSGWVEPKVGIGQQAHLVRTPAGNLLWDMVGYLDDDAVRRVRGLGEVVAIVASQAPAGPGADHGEPDESPLLRSTALPTGWRSSW